MKKFFAFVAAALVAFSFVSCEKEDVGSKFFKITVSDIEQTTARVAVVPADTTVYYAVPMCYASELAKYTADSVAANYVDYLNGLAQAYGANTLISYKVINKGELSGPVDELAPQTEYAVLACQVIVDEEANTVTLGKEISYKIFKTKDIELAGEVDLGELEKGYFEDYRSEDGSYMAYGYDEAQTKMVALNIFDDDFVGNFTEADLDLEYSYIFTSEMSSQYGLAIVKAEFESKLAGQDEATVKGWVIATDGIKYQFKFTHPTVESDGAGAPAKVRAAKKANELKSALKVFHVNK